MIDTGNGWNENKKYVIQSIDRIEHKLDTMDETQRVCRLDCSNEITKLKVKSAIWGAIIGLVVSLTVTVVGSVMVHYFTNDVIKENTEVSILSEDYKQEHINKLNIT